ncbi:LacI family transcription regulator [Mycobacterium avium subsp. paratuberculosis 11-1786]|nr:LacI family transcription regulator [Mycobacterium avium subsp. paratuberculosis 11-1786]
MSSRRPASRCTILMKIVSITKPAGEARTRAHRSAVASPSVSPTPRRRATLVSLADELKVSRTTVSNAFNRPDQLSADLRERVLATAKRLGYPGPDPVARSLRTRKAGAVGLVMAEPLTYFFSDPAARDFVTGVAQSCEALGQGLLLVAVGPSRSLDEGTAAVLSAGVDGFVVYSVCDDDPYLQAVLQRRLPVVVVDQPKGLTGVSRVGIDDRAAMRELADYVLGLGHREIGLLTMRLGRDRRQGLVDAERLRSPAFDVQRERITGVWEAMTAAGVDPDSLTVVESYEHLPESGGAAAKVALEANPRITALMCTADILALSAMDYLRAHGVYVPGQLTVTGFDGVPDAISRGLTTVSQSSLHKGRRAGELLLKPARSGLPVVELLDTELIRGRTAGPPA